MRISVDFNDEYLPHQCRPESRLYEISALFCVGWPPLRPDVEDTCVGRCAASSAAD